MVYIYTDPVTAVNDNLKLKSKIFDFTVSNEKYVDSLITEPSQIWSNMQPDFYQFIGLDIVAETVFDYPYPYVSEKTFRPMSCKRPFILVGPPNTLNFLHSLGFKTFSHIINESYDSIIDPEKRLFAIIDEIKKFVNSPISSIIDIVKECEPILNHNFQNLLNFEENELTKIKNILNQGTK